MRDCKKEPAQNLIDLGRAYFEKPDRVSADLAAFGLAEEEPQAPEAFQVLPENWPAFELFMACQQDWNYTPMGMVLGLDKAALLATMQMYQIPPEDQKERLNQIMLIVRGALEVLRKD
mgnify:CR=1 FL=1